MFDRIKDIIRGTEDESEKVFCSAVIVAAGKGNRMNTDVNKQFMYILDRPLLSYTLEAFEACELIDEVIIVTREDEIMICKELVEDFAFNKANKIVVGGAKRQESVFKGIKEVDARASIIAIHDGARPLVLPQDITLCIQEAVNCKAAALGVKVKDTIKLVDKSLNIKQTPDRNRLWAVQTPQVFRVEVIKAAHEEAMSEGVSATDDCALVERTGIKVKMVEGSYENIKITTPEDIFIAEAILRYREEGEVC